MAGFPLRFAMQLQQASGLGSVAEGVSLTMLTMSA